MLRNLLMYTYVVQFSCLSTKNLQWYKR